MRIFSLNWSRFGLIAVVLMLLLAGSQCKKQSEIPITTKSQEARELFLQARQLGEDLLLDEAIVLLNDAIEKDPEFALAYLYRARYIGEPVELKRNLDQAVALAPQTTAGEQAIIDAYRAYYEENNPARTIAFYEKVVQMYPEDKRARWRLGAFFRNLNMPDKGMEELQRALSLDPDFAPAQLDIGYAYLYEGEYEQAEKAFQKYISLKPQQPNPYDSLADLYSIQGRFEDAIMYYQKALEKKPDFVESQRKMGINLILLGEYEEGRGLLRKVFTMDRAPERRADFLCQITRSYLYEEDYPAALEAADECIRFGTEHEVAGQVVINYLAKCMIYAESEEYDQAEESLEFCRNIFENAELPAYFREIYADSLYFWEAVIAAKKKDFNRAVAIANRYRDDIEMSQNPNRSQYNLGLLGCIEMERGFPDIAREYFRQAEIKEPLFLLYAARAEAAGGSRAESARLYKTAANLNQDSIWYAYVRPKALARK
jgi:tetratricopeptide (TPR) repeat protein